jgi:FkbM family methyltransferase
MIFDVEANVGDTALAFRRHFPSATIHCFEPNSELAPHLNGLNANLNVHSVALSSRIGECGSNKSGSSSDVYFLTDDKSGEIVALDTVDNFCKSKSIDHIHYLKIDTEGHDLEVLKGASSMLADFRIDLVQTEVSMNPDNNLHVSFLKVANHLPVAENHRLTWYCWLLVAIVMRWKRRSAVVASRPGRPGSGASARNGRDRPTIGKSGFQDR